MPAQVHSAIHGQSSCIVSHRYWLFIFEIVTCMGTREDTHKDKTSFSLDETSNNKSKFSNFCQKTSNFLVISEYVLLCVTETVTLVLERQLVSQNLRHASEGDIPRSYVFWIGQNGAQGAETLWVCFQKACPPLQCHMPIGFLFQGARGRAPSKRTFFGTRFSQVISMNVRTCGQHSFAQRFLFHQFSDNCTKSCRMALLGQTRTRIWS